MNNLSKMILATGACICLSLPTTAMALATVNDFVGVWTSNSGNNLEYSQNGNQIDVIMVDPSPKFKELGYLPGEVTGHYQFSRGKITGRVLLKFTGCNPVWAAASNEIDDDGTMTVQVSLLRCNTNTGNWEYLAGINKATLKKAPAGRSTTDTQTPSSVDGSPMQGNQQPLDAPPQPPQQTAPLQDEPPLANNSTSQNDEAKSQNISQEPSIVPIPASPPDTKAINSSPSSTPNPSKPIKETVGEWCVAVGVILVLLGIGKRDRRFTSGFRGGSSTALAFGIFLVVVGAILIFIPITLLVAICAVPFILMAIREVMKREAERKEKLAEDERARIARTRMEEDTRRADEGRDFLLAKYGDDRIVDRIISNEFWLGQTSEQLQDSLGTPSHVGNQTRSGETWKYGETGKNRYALHIMLKNDVVADWKDNR